MNREPGKFKRLRKPGHVPVGKDSGSRTRLDFISWFLRRTSVSFIQSSFGIESFGSCNLALARCSCLICFIRCFSCWMSDCMDNWISCFIANLLRISGIVSKEMSEDERSEDDEEMADDVSEEDEEVGEESRSK